jgi:hypothetical protein
MSQKSESSHKTTDLMLFTAANIGPDAIFASLGGAALKFYITNFLGTCSTTKLQKPRLIIKLCKPHASRIN